MRIYDEKNLKFTEVVSRNGVTLFRVDWRKKDPMASWRITYPDGHIMDFGWWNKYTEEEALHIFNTAISMVTTDAH